MHMVIRIYHNTDKKYIIENKINFLNGIEFCGNNCIESLTGVVIRDAKTCFC